MTDTSTLIPPYGDVLVDLLVEDEALWAHANTLPSIQLSERAVCDLELLAAGGFSPLDRFMNQVDYERVLGEMRLVSGHIFPIPINLSVSRGGGIELDKEIALRNDKNELLAVMTVEEIYPWEGANLAERVFGTTDPRHPLVAEMQRWGELNISGRLKVFGLPRRYDFRELRMTPTQARSALEANGRNNVVAFQTRNPLHRAHEELTRRAIEEREATLLLHPAVGMTKPGDVDHYTRVRTYKAMQARYFEPGRIVLALLPLAMRMAGPREALWHAVIRRNYGANNLIVGRDHASPGVKANGEAFYGPYEAQELVEQHSAELGVEVVPFRELVYLPDDGEFAEESQVVSGKRVFHISGSSIREDYLDNGNKPPDWVLREEVAEILADARPPRYRQGVCVWFTGLSGAGKSTTAEVLTALLLERGRQVTVLDGDVVRTHLSKGLGFSKADRDTNVRRIGFVASEIARHGGVVLCAAVSPYRATRNDVRSMVGGDHFVEVFVDTPLEVCEKRDTKGLYAQARRGEISGFTGVDDPYEQPKRAEITLDTLNASPEENALKILIYLEGLGFAKPDSGSMAQEDQVSAAVAD